MEKKYEFITGETVRLKACAFQLFTGKVVSANKEKGTLKVVVSVLGKWRTVELHFSEVEKSFLTGNRSLRGAPQKSLASGTASPTHDKV